MHWHSRWQTRLLRLFSPNVFEKVFGSQADKGVRNLKRGFLTPFFGEVLLLSKWRFFRFRPCPSPILSFRRVPRPTFTPKAECPAVQQRTANRPASTLHFTFSNLPFRLPFFVLFVMFVFGKPRGHFSGALYQIAWQKFKQTFCAIFWGVTKREGKDLRNLF
jgi:hypothetical protein